MNQLIAATMTVFRKIVRLGAWLMQKVQMAADPERAAAAIEARQQLINFHLNDENLSKWTAEAARQGSEGAAINSGDGEVIFITCYRPPLQERVSDHQREALDSFGRFIVGAELAASHEHSGQILDIAGTSFGDNPGISFIRRIPQESGRGFNYIATAAIPFKELTYQIAIVCPERGRTGVRESMVLMEECRANGLSLADAEAMKRIDPYDKKYDLLVPAHPLTSARRRLEFLTRYLEVDPGINEKYSSLQVPATAEIQAIANTL